MAQPYVGEIRIFAGNFAPAGWMFCEGQLLPISEYDVLFQLIGTSYGGNGQTTFGLPDLRGRIPVHFGNGFTLAETGGSEETTLSPNQMPTHSHSLIASSDNATKTTAPGNVPATTPAYTPYINATPNTLMNAQSVSSTGGGLPHTNLQPYLCLDFIISLFGIFPSQT